MAPPLLRLAVEVISNNDEMMNLNRKKDIHEHHNMSGCSHQFVSDCSGSNSRSNSDNNNNNNNNDGDDDDDEDKDVTSLLPSLRQLNAYVCYHNDDDDDVDDEDGDACNSMERRGVNIRPVGSIEVMSVLADGKPCQEADNISEGISTCTSSVNFAVGNPTVEITTGILHVFRSFPSSSTTAITASTSTSLRGWGGSPLPTGRTPLLCMLSVPGKIPYSELLSFLGPVLVDVKQMQLLREQATSPHHYMALLEFSQQELADQFFRCYNGRQYNSLEPDVCHMAFVDRIEIIQSGCNSSVLLKSSRIKGYDGDNTSNRVEEVLESVELPSCPVCLERLDEHASGIITTMCDHVFHCDCLAKAVDSRCPVCRFCLKPEASHNQCMASDCPSRQSLWMCLVCGHVGCGRYDNGHARVHFIQTQHTYSMELETQRVWDYVGDNYVHRLIQNRNDGKLVEFANGNPEYARAHSGRSLIDGHRPSSAASAVSGGMYYSNNCGGDLEMLAAEEKVDSIQLEYTYLLTTQLEAQRDYFRGCLSRAEEEAAAAVSKAESGEAMAYALSKTAEKERRISERKYNQVCEKLEGLKTELANELEMNNSLRANQEVYQQQISDFSTKMIKLRDEKDVELAELQSQVRDLMFYLESQQKVAESPNSTEIREGRVVVPETPPELPAVTNRRRKKR